MRIVLTLLLLLSAGAAHAAATGTAWGTLAVAPACDGTSCSLSLSTGPGDLTIVHCSAGIYGPCSVIPAGSIVIIPISARPVLAPCLDSPLEFFDATDLPRWYRTS